MSTPDGEFRGGRLPGAAALSASRLDGHGGDDDDDGWMLSYIDVFTLITIFFVVLLVYARLHSEETSQKLQQSEATLSAQLEKISQLQQENEVDKLAEAARQAAIQIWQAQLTRRIVDEDLSESVQFTLRDDAVELNVQDSVLFAVANAQVQNNGRELLARITPLLKQTEGQIFIEGHTDNQPIENARFHSNWELGAARATAVVQQLTTLGIPAKRLRAVTAGDTQPIASNATDEGRRQNRRVTFVLRPPSRLPSASAR